MAVAFVKQTTGVVSVATTAPTMAVTSTAGNALIAIMGGSGGSTGTATAMTDTGGNTWVKAATIGVSGGANTFLTIWYTLTGNSPGTITATTSSQTFQWKVVEFSGVGAVDVAPAGASAASSTTINTPTATTTAVGDVIVGAINSASTGTYTLAAGSGSWNALTDPATQGSLHMRSAYKIGTAAQAENASWTLSVAGTAGTGILALKAAAASTPVSGSDAATGTESTPSVSVTATGSDTATGSEGTPTTSVTASGSDAASGTDSGSTSATGSSSDTGSGTDSATASVTASGSDAGTGTDSGSVADVTGGPTVLSDADTASASEAASLIDLTPVPPPPDDPGDESSIYGLPLEPPLTVRSFDFGVGVETASLVDLTPKPPIRLPEFRIVRKITASDSAVAREGVEVGVTVSGSDSGVLAKETARVYVLEDPQADGEDRDVLMMLGILSDL